MDDKNNKMKIGHRFALGASVSLFLVFSFLVFGPLSLYITGEEELWFSFNSLLIPVLIISGVAMVLCTLATSLPGKGIHKALCCLVFGTALGLYIQGNFFNISYGSGVLDGSEIVWKDYTTYGAIDCAMWAACLALPFAFCMVFKKQWRVILMWISIALVIVQSITLSFLVYQNYDTLNKVTYEVTTEGMYDLSSKDNTIVFVLDSFDQQYYNRIKKAHPEYFDKLQGFTEYNNTLASGARDIISFPSMMTGSVYKKDTAYSNYIDKAWSGDTVFSQLHKNGVDSRIFAETTFFGKGATDDIANIVDHTQEVGSYTALTKTMYKYTIFSYFPHYLKKYFWLDTAAFAQFRSENAYTGGDAEFYNNYKINGGFDYTDDYSKTLRLYSLEGAKAPYTLTDDATRNHDGTSLYNQLDGCFKYLFEMLEDMKTNGVYDNANIIITSDHGDVDLVQHPVMLIKKSGENEGYKQSKAPLSMFDLSPTLASTVTEDYSRYGSGKTFFDISEDEQRTRFFYLNTGSNNDARVEEYQVKSTADDVDDMELINCYYTNAGKTTAYELGDELSFNIDATANVYCTEGFRQTTGWRTPMAGPVGQMVIPIEKIPSDAEDLHVYFGIPTIDKVTNCTIKANGKVVFAAKVDNSFNKDGLNLLVPTSLIGQDNTLTLDFEFSGISKDEMQLDTNNRTMTISFNTFKIYTQ